MPILRPHAAWFDERHISSVTFTSAHLYGNVYMRVGVAGAMANSSDFGHLREQSSQKWEIPCFGCRWTAMQNKTPLALSSVEKSVTVQTQTNTETVTDISTPWLSACVDNNRPAGMMRWVHIATPVMIGKWAATKYKRASYPCRWWSRG